MLTDVEELGRFVGQAQHSLFRLETLDHYDVSSDGGDFLRYVRGEDGPDMTRKAAWHKALQANLDRGVTTRRVHVVRSPLSDYLRYEFNWGYAYNLAYEDIRILDTAERMLPPALAGIGDFWLVDRQSVAVMHYDAAGCYFGFDAITDAGAVPFVQAADAAWRTAEPFTDYRAGRRVA
jgi:hypothetical protein